MAKPKQFILTSIPMYPLYIQEVFVQEIKPSFQKMVSRRGKDICPKTNQ